MQQTSSSGQRRRSQHEQHPRAHNGAQLPFVLSIDDILSICQVKETLLLKMPPNTPSVLNSCVDIAGCPVRSSPCKDNTLFTQARTEPILNSPSRLSDHGIGTTSPTRRMDSIESKVMPTDSPVLNYPNNPIAPPLDGNAYWNVHTSQAPQYASPPFYASPPYTPYNLPPSSPWGSFPLSPPVTGGGGGIVTNTLQILFSIQSVLFSLGQVVQIIGSNTSAIDHLYHQCNTLFRSWIGRIQNISTGNFLLESSSSVSQNSIVPKDDKEKNRRRIKAIRYGLILSASFMGCRWLQLWWKKRAEYVRYLKYYQEMASKAESFKSK